MKLTPQQYALALYESVQQVGPNDHDKVLDNFVKVLAQNGDLGKYEEIEAEYKRLEMKKKGIKEVEITVAREMEINQRIIDDLNRIVAANVGADIIRPLQKIDESLIGGVVIRVDDTLIDASIKGQLQRLNKELKS